MPSGSDDIDIDIDIDADDETVQHRENDNLLSDESNKFTERDTTVSSSKFPFTKLLLAKKLIETIEITDGIIELILYPEYEADAEKIQKGLGNLSCRSDEFSKTFAVLTVKSETIPTLGVKEKGIDLSSEDILNKLFECAKQNEKVMYRELLAEGELIDAVDIKGDLVSFTFTPSDERRSILMINRALHHMYAELPEFKENFKPPVLSKKIVQLHLQPSSIGKYTNEKLLDQLKTWAKINRKFLFKKLLNTEGFIAKIDITKEGMVEIHIKQQYYADIIRINNGFRYLAARDPLYKETFSSYEVKDYKIHLRLNPRPSKKEYTLSEITDILDAFSKTKKRIPPKNPFPFTKLLKSGELIENISRVGNRIDIHVKSQYADLGQNFRRGFRNLYYSSKMLQKYFKRPPLITKQPYFIFKEGLTVEFSDDDIIYLIEQDKLPEQSPSVEKAPAQLENHTDSSQHDVVLEQQNKFTPQYLRAIQQEPQMKNQIAAPTQPTTDTRRTQPLL